MHCVGLHYATSSRRSFPLCLPSAAAVAGLSPASFQTFTLSVPLATHLDTIVLPCWFVDHSFRLCSTSPVQNFSDTLEHRLSFPIKDQSCLPPLLRRIAIYERRQSSSRGSLVKAEVSGPALVGLSRLGINLEYDLNRDVESRLPILEHEFDARRKTH